VDMYTVVSKRGQFIARSRLLEVAMEYMTNDTVMYKNGVLMELANA
jgi:hypothetical protein